MTERERQISALVLSSILLLFLVALLSARCAPAPLRDTVHVGTPTTKATATLTPQPIATR